MEKKDDSLPLKKIPNGTNRHQKGGHMHIQQGTLGRRLAPQQNLSPKNNKDRTLGWTNQKSQQKKSNRGRGRGENMEKKKVTMGVQYNMEPPRVQHRNLA